MILVEYFISKAIDFGFERCRSFFLQVTNGESTAYNAPTGAYNVESTTYNGKSTAYNAKSTQQNAV
jgi:hypothetical protein